MVEKNGTTKLTDFNVTMSNEQRFVEAERAVKIETLKLKLKSYREIALHLSTARKRYTAQLSDERYAAAGYVGDPEENLISAVNNLRGVQASPKKEDVN
jgi:hypothetical protein